MRYLVSTLGGLYSGCVFMSSGLYSGLVFMSSGFISETLLY